MAGYDLPTDPEAKRAMLERAFGIGTRIAELARVGEPVGPLRDYAAGQPDLSIEEDAGRLRFGFPGGVSWQVGVAADGLIEGMGASGYGPLMEALGIDFSGAPYTPGNWVAGRARPRRR